MTRVVYKYLIPCMQLPEGARLLTVAEQDGKHYVWVETDDAQLAGNIRRDVCLVGTGQQVDPGYTYVGTIHTTIGLVWHVYDSGEIR